MTIDNKFAPGSDGGNKSTKRADLIGDLESGRIDADEFVRRAHPAAITKRPEHAEAYVRGIGLTIEYRPFVASETLRPDGSVAYYSEERRDFTVSNARSGGEVEDDWSAIGLTALTDRDGNPLLDANGRQRDGYLIIKSDGKGGVLNKVVDIVTTEKLTLDRNQEKKKELAGASAAGMVVAVESKGSHQQPNLITAADVQAVLSRPDRVSSGVAERQSPESTERQRRIAELNEEIKNAIKNMQANDKMIDGRRSSEWNYWNEQLADANKERTRLERGGEL